MIQFTQSSRFIRYKADPIFYPTCDLEQEGKLAICNFRPVVTGQQAAQAGDTEEKIAPRVTRRLRPSQLRPEIEDSNNQTRLYSALCGLGPNKTVTAGKQFSNTENTDFIPVLQRLTVWLTKKWRETKGSKFILVALEKYFHGRDGIVCVFAPALSICLIVLGSDSPLSRLVTNYPLVFRPRSGGGRVFWMLMRALPGNFWTFHLKIATILSGSGDSSYLW